MDRIAAFFKILFRQDSFRLGYSIMHALLHALPLYVLTYIVYFKAAFTCYNARVNGV